MAGSHVISKGRATRSLVALALAAASFGTAASPGIAADAPPVNVWVKGPSALGDNTYVGKIEAPRINQNVAEGADLLVSGWAADKTARGWAGFDAVEVWSGAKDSDNATRLGSGFVGMSRPDIAKTMGDDFLHSGFSVVVPATALEQLGGPTEDLDIYLHTASKGWWHQTVGVNLQNFGADEPINTFLRPLDGSIISQKQKYDKFSFFGYALDPTPITDPGNQGLSSCECGISSVAVYVDQIDAAHSLGNAGMNALVAFANKGKPTYQPLAAFSPVTRTYGRQYDKAAWAFSINPRQYTADWHTFYAIAKSSITGKTSMAQVRMFIRDVPDNARIVAP
jgi:hypothetical protein